jgi:hypothetical protein
MQIETFAAQMQRSAESIRTLATGIGNEQARWRPADKAWSILEVINHLDDEERLDFRVRLDIMLHRPDEAWPRIDPAGWVTERRYNERDLSESLTNFLTARLESLAWLHTLQDPDWGASYEAPFGEIKAGDMFAAWVAHDILHLRQLVKLHWALTSSAVAPYRTLYAGEW